MTAEAITAVEARAYTVPTAAPESDGTLRWDSTTIVVCEATAAGRTGLGYSYTDSAAVGLINGLLASVVVGTDPLATASTWAAMVDTIRNLGRPGIVSSAIAAVDLAVWDLKGRLLERSVSDLLGRAHDSIVAYGSGGFTSLDDCDLRNQLSGWVEEGLTAVKMKVGRDPADDPRRVAIARDAIGDAVELFVDANGAYTAKQALALADAFAVAGVTWFEEPVSSDDLDGLAAVRAAVPPGMDVTAGEYGYDLPYFRAMLDAGAVDCLQADVTRCAGITGFTKVGALADSHCLDLSSHTAPQVSAHACAGVWHVRHLEYFADHVRLESMLFDGGPPSHRRPSPARSRPARFRDRAEDGRCRTLRCLTCPPAPPRHRRYCHPRSQKRQP